MLRRVLQEIESAQGPVNRDELGRRLGIESDVLEGLLQTLVRLGRLRDDGAVPPACDMHCAGCRTSQPCPMPLQPLRYYSVVSHVDDNLRG